MAAGPSIDVSGWLKEQLAQASPDLLRAMGATFAEALMGACPRPATAESHAPGPYIAIMPSDASAGAVGSGGHGLLRARRRATAAL